MKFILPTLILILYKYNYMMTITTSTLLLLKLIFSSNNIMINSFTMNDQTSQIMLILTLISVNLIILSSSNKKIKLTMIPILFILMLTFSCSNMISFYISFEIVLIPTILLIMMSGKQFERIQASLYLIIYTILASLPLMISIILMKNPSFLLSWILMYKYYLSMMMMMAFLVKMPMYFTHLWLPKAHVEAPLEGSMILAAILLKLGGYGLIRIMPICIKNINSINPMIISISLIGASATSLNCIRQKDLKSLIAYSSVAHMGFTLLGIFSLNSLGMHGAVIMMIAHGMSSSALFLLVNEMYTKFSTRNISSFKGMMSIMPNLTFWWFMFMSINISAPPTINTISEIFLMSSTMYWNMSSMTLIFSMSLMTASFSMLMFININHNKNITMPLIQTNSKISLSLFSHMIPLILMMMKMEMINILLFSLHKTMTCGVMISQMINYSIILMMISIMSFYLSLEMMNLNMFISMNYFILNLKSLNISINMLMDWISLLFISTVLFISSMIIMFSMYYIPKKEQKQFSLMLLMFILSMNILILSNNIFLMLLGWDGLGLSSYILVVYYQNHSTAASGSITLLSNRIGDIMILMSMGLLFTMKSWSFPNNENFPKITLTLLMIAACTKSAQFPFSAWLPMAMAAPTPISALVHSSTLVTAGVFLLIRILNSNHPTTMLLLMMIASSTTLYASMSATWEQDLKKVIALSTLSQIAMMMFAISINAMNMAFMHLIIHAMFKSTMFMCAGIMIHESSYQDMRMMGMNSTSIPLTSSTLGITSMSLMGIPFMSGFFSKDTIIEKMINSKMESLFTLMMISSIGMTMTYSIRMSILSNKFLLKSQPNLNNHNSNYYNITITMMSLMIITSGTSIMWYMNPEQMLLIPTKFKMMILIIILMTTILSFMMKYKNNNYMMLGLPAISLWFNHTLSTFTSPNLFPSMKIFEKNDKSWQEMYGPSSSYNSISLTTPTFDMYKYTKMTILLMIMIIPMTFLT